MSLLPTFLWAGHALACCQRKAELDRRGKNRFYSGAIVAGQRDQGREVDSTPDTTGQVGIENQVAGGGGAGGFGKSLRGNIRGTGGPG